MKGTIEGLKDILQETIEIAFALVEREQSLEVEPPASPDDVRRAVELALPMRGHGRKGALEKVARVVALTPRTSGRRFYNQLFAGREPLATSAEMLTSLMNSSMYTYKIAGVQALIELEVIAKLCSLAGYENGEGTFVPGGSLGNLVGMVLAVFEARPDHREQGMSGPRLRIYLSADGHYSVAKNAGLLGLGRANVRSVPVDGLGRMRADLLQAMIQEDREAGHEPVCVVATSGTTVAGAFDPLVEIGAVARQEDIWLHVDGALGGSFLLHTELRRKLEGVDQADSFSWDAHKLMGAPLSCAAVLVRRKGLLKRHFNQAAAYLYQQDDDQLNLGTRSIQCGRRNDAFKLWAAWQDLGDKGWHERLERQLALLSHARSCVEKDPAMELVLEPEGLSLCFVVTGVSSAVLCERLGSLGLELVGHGMANGRQVIRLVTANPELECSDIDRFFADLQEVVAQLEKRP